MAVLVTGGAGYIGGHILLELLAAGEKAIVLDDLSTGFEVNIPRGVPLITGSVGDGALLDKVLQSGEVDAVIHLAASLIVSESVAHPDKYWTNNTANSRVLFEACVRNGVRRLVFSSTAAVYGDIVGARAQESQTPNPTTPYGRSKLATEWQLQDFAHAYDLNFVALRYFNVAGADRQLRVGQRSPRATHVFKAACEAALGRRPYLEVFGDDYPTSDGTGVRDYIHVTDLSRAHLSALRGLRSGALRRETLNCGYGRGYSVRDVAAALSRAHGVQVPVRVSPRRAGDVAEVVADCSAILEKTDWRPLHDDLDVIATDALNWEKTLEGEALPEQRTSGGTL